MRLSIAMCTYNGERFLEEQLLSISQQTRQPHELVVCDDGSSDRTNEILKSFALASPFPVILSKNSQRLGSTRNFEQAISLCCGDIIALSDQDDVWFPCKLMLLEQALSSSPGIGLAFSDAEVVDEGMRPLGYRLWQSTFTADDQRRVKRGQSLQVLLSQNVVTGATMAFRAQFRDFILPFPEIEDLFFHDGWIALAISTIAEIAMIEKPLMRYRQHRGQQLGASKRKRLRRGFLTQHLEMAKAWRAGVYRVEISQMKLLQEQLSLYPDRANLPHLVPYLNKRMNHILFRARLPQSRLKRAPRILKEVLLFRYQRFSKGLKSAAQDLLF